MSFPNSDEQNPRVPEESSLNYRSDTPLFPVIKLSIIAIVGTLLGLILLFSFPVYDRALVMLIIIPFALLQLLVIKHQESKLRR